MITKLQIENTDQLVASITITMKLSEWKDLDKQLTDIKNRHTQDSIQSRCFTVIVK